MLLEAQVSIDTHNKVGKDNTAQTTPGHIEIDTGVYGVPTTPTWLLSW